MIPSIKIAGCCLYFTVTMTCSQSSCLMCLFWGVWYVFVKSAKEMDHAKCWKLLCVCFPMERFDNLDDVIESWWRGMMTMMMVMTILMNKNTFITFHFTPMIPFNYHTNMKYYKNSNDLLQPTLSTPAMLHSSQGNLALLRPCFLGMGPVDFHKTLYFSYLDVPRSKWVITPTYPIYK